MVPLGKLQELAGMAPQTETPRHEGNGQTAGYASNGRIDVGEYLRAHNVGVLYESEYQGNGGRKWILERCVWNPEHSDKSAFIIQWPSGAVAAGCQHDSCRAKTWHDFRDAVEPGWRERRASGGKGGATCGPIPAGTRVYASDRGNWGEVTEDLGAACRVHFRNPTTGDTAEPVLPKSELSDGTGKPLASNPEAKPLPPIIPLSKVFIDYPKLRPPVIHKLLRQGETMNVIAAAKANKTWLMYGLAFCIASGRSWFGIFDCEPGRVLLIDGELHRESVSHRLFTVADALATADDPGIDSIDVWPLRGESADLLRLGERFAEVKPGRYAVVILDALYRFIPPGVSENDNAAVMALYNRIDAYAAHLESAWINVHHASKGDQTGKGITDVGSGAGSQSRAADTHLIIRPHETEGVAVIEAAVRSWPPVERLAVRFDYPLWTLDVDADPRRLAGTAAQRAHVEKREADKSELVRIALKLGPSLKTTLRKATGWGGDKFHRVFGLLESDGTFHSTMGEGAQGQKCLLWEIRQDEEI